MGKKTDAALGFLDSVLDDNAPWCCFVSFTEPHDPFHCHEDAFAQYDVESIPLQPNVHNDLSGQPNLYKRAAQVWSDWTDREHREGRGLLLRLDQRDRPAVRASAGAGRTRRAA